VQRGSFGTQLGFYFAAIGSAFGLGSLWRFPFIVAENGGGAFVLLYILLLMIVGLPLLIGELMLGKVAKRSAVAAFSKIEVESMGQKESLRIVQLGRLVGPMTVICCALILAYYAVISGWVMYFLMQFSIAPFTSDPVEVSLTMSVLREKGWQQVILAGIHLGLVTIIVAKGVEDGLERWVGYLIPIFVAVVFMLMLRALQLESAASGLRFFLYPDFARLKWESIGAAIGQLCFTLSIGFGTMITFGSYLQNKTKVPSTGFRVAFLDSMVCIIGGLLMFPLIVSGGETRQIIGPELLFRVVPKFLIGLDGGYVFGFFFFLCLYLAAVGASVSIMETIVANLSDRFNVNRSDGTLMSLTLVFLFSIIPALSTSVFANFEWQGRGVLELIDYTLIQWIVPILALITSQIVVRRLSRRLQSDEFMGEHIQTSQVLFTHWRFLMHWVIPPIIVLGLAFQIAGLF
jgi:NSS family neurotransmitter:Na+ symporter